MRNQVEFKVSGRYALFTDPLTKIGGEKSTLLVPTYQALKGICESVYYKPSIIWIIDEVKILNPIRTESKGIRPIKYNGGNDLAYYTYLKDVSYIVKAHFIFNKNRMDLSEDFNEHKHHNIMKRSIKKGGRRDVFLGVRECQAYVEEVVGDEVSYYDNEGEIDFGNMYHSLLYPDQSGENQLETLFWSAKMVNGVIQFCKQEECVKRAIVRKMEMKTFTEDDYSSVDSEYEKMFADGEED